MKNNLQILAVLVATMLATGCKQSNQANEYPAASDTNSLSVTQQLQNAKEVATNTWQKVKDTTTNAWAGVKEGTSNAWDDAKDSVQPLLGIRLRSCGCHGIFRTRRISSLQNLQQTNQVDSSKACL